ncbi:MAG: hypothetical protein JWM87_4547 [Candidatus Eremiobacteraeota bacterium]|nr:hypothetical protein [Candidatus Eremiobacteraeota bacterium]
MRVPSFSPAIRSAAGRIAAPALVVAMLVCSMTATGQAQTVAPADETAAAAAQTVAPADQASPAPAAPPAGQTNPRPGAPQSPSQGSPSNPSGGPTQTRSVPAPAARFSNYPVIDFVVTFTQPAYYGNRNATPIGAPSVVNGYSPVDVGGTFRLPITRKLNLLFDRVTEGTLNQPLECVLQSNPPVPGAATIRVCPSATRDVLLQYHATYAFDRYVTLDVGDSFRHRIWNNGASGVSTVPFLCNNNGRSTGANCTISSTEHHFGYAGLSYTTKPWRNYWNSAFSFALTADHQNVDHHVAVACSAGNLTGPTRLPPAQLSGCPAIPNANTIGYYDENPNTSAYWESTQGVTWILPVDPRHGTTFTLNERWGALNFYENPGLFPAFGTTIGVPYRWNSALTYQLSKRFSPGMTIALRHSDFHATTQGTPFLAPNAIHVGSWDVIGTFHVDTKTFFGM